MTQDRFDVVVYGASGFTGAYILRAIAGSALFKDKTIAVAGRSESKLKKVLDEIASETGVNAVRGWPVIVADTSDEASLAAMAKRARLIINAVGPYRLLGEPVVRAAVENGASHVDISGEPAFLELMQLKYAEHAKEKGVYVIGACGWDSIPCDLGVDFLKRNFDGTLANVETVVRSNSGPAGYAINNGTYQTLILGISSMRTDNLGKIRRTIMPQRLPESKSKPPKRSALWHCQEGELDSWVLPFLGSDKSIVQRSQYYDYHANNRRPVLINTYYGLSSLFWAVLVTLWLTVFAIFAMFGPTRRLLQAYPDLCSFGMFKADGPSKEQIAGASFAYYFFGTGWAVGEKPDEGVVPMKKESAICRGPDAGYVATAGCITAAAAAILHDKDRLPKEGGVYTTASALRDTKIYDHLKSFGITFEKL